jgi:hypothetical protein
VTALVEFQRITCQDQNDFASDEPYLLYNGQLLMPEQGDVDPGDSRTIDVIKTLEGEARVDLWDADGAFPFDDHDFLASVTISESEVGQGQKIQKMKGNGAAYTLFYRVHPFPSA